MSAPNANQNPKARAARAILRILEKLPTATQRDVLDSVGLLIDAAPAAVRARDLAAEAG